MKQLAYWKDIIEKGGYVNTVCSNCGTTMAVSYGETKHNCFCDVCGARMIRIKNKES